MSISAKRLNAFAEKATQERDAKVYISYSLEVLMQFKREAENWCKAGLIPVLDTAEPSPYILGFLTVLENEEAIEKFMCRQ